MSAVNTWGPVNSWAGNDPAPADITTPDFSADILPPTGMKVTTLGVIDPSSLFAGAGYSGNAGGDANNVGTDDQIIYDAVTPDGYDVDLDSAGLFTITGTRTDTGAGIESETQSQTIQLYYLEAQEGYAASNVMTLTVFVGSAPDTTAPVISLTGNATETVAVGNAYNDAGATASDDTDGDITADIVTVNPVDINTIGSYTITYNVSDAAGNAATEVTRTVNVVAVVDSTPPVITLTGAASVNHTIGTTYTDPGATASDNVDGDITNDIVVVGADFDVNTLGSNTITYNVSDAAGNAATEVTRTVTVVAAGDTQAPVINLTGNASITLDQNDTYTEQGATWTDNIDGTGAAVVSGDSVDTSTPGTYTVRYNYTDAAGNAAVEVTRTVTVNAVVADTTPPVIALIGDNPLTVVQNSTWSDPGANVTDDTDATRQIEADQIVDTSALGTVTLTYNTQDAAGNAAVEVSRDVTVIEPTPVVAPPINFMPTLLATSIDQITVFRGRENSIDVTVTYEGDVIDLTVFDRYELYGLSADPIDTDESPGSVAGDASGNILLNVGLFTTEAGLVETTLIAFGTDYPNGVVLWDSSLARSRVSAQIVDTFNPEEQPLQSLQFGVRIQLISRTNEELLANGSGFDVHIVEKGVTLYKLSTDAEGYIVIQDVSLDTLGEDVGIAIESSDGALTGFTRQSVEDVSAYLL